MTQTCPSEHVLVVLFPHTPCSSPRSLISRLLQELLHRNSPHLCSSPPASILHHQLPTLTMNRNPPSHRNPTKPREPDPSALPSPGIQSPSKQGSGCELHSRSTVSKSSGEGCSVFCLFPVFFVCLFVFTNPPGYFRVGLRSHRSRDRWTDKWTGRQLNQ